MSAKAMALVIGVVCLAAPAGADEAPPPDTAGGRYVFAKEADRQGNGYVRLDTQTGEVSLCSQRAVGWACTAAPDDRAVFENEIARLRAENAALKKDLVTHGLPLPPGTTAESSSTQSNQLTVQLPSDAQIARVMAFAARIWHRFVAAVERAQKQILNKS